MRCCTERDIKTQMYSNMCIRDNLVEETIQPCNPTYSPPFSFPDFEHFDEGEASFSSSCSDLSDF